MGGEGLGRKLGFATANLKVSSEKILPRGVFIIEGQWEGGPMLKGMCNIGCRPTVSQKNKLTLEAHFFDFKKTLYGKTLNIFLLAPLRAEKQFASLAALRHQLQKDKMKAQEFLSIPPPKI